jgi:hypothetical protein
MLDIDGENWPVFSKRFEYHMNNLRLDAHFNSENYPPESYEEIKGKPIKGDTEPDDGFEKRLSEWKEGEEQWTKRRRAWERDDANAELALGTVIPDTLYLEIMGHERFCEMWKAVEARMELTAPRHRSNLKNALNQMYCTERDDVMAHLEDMEAIYQQLASRNAKISDEDYVDALIRSLPRSYTNSVTPLLTIYSAMNQPVTPAAIKDAIRTEYEARQKAALARNMSTPHANANRRASGRGGGRANGDRGRSGLTCFNCGGKGHKAAICPSPKKGRNRPAQQ